MRRTLFTEDHELFRESFRTFVEQEIAPHHLEWNEAGVVPRELFATGGRRGFPGHGRARGVRRRRRRRLPLQPGHRRGDPDGRRRPPPASGLTLHNDICLPYFLSLTTDEQQTPLAAGHRARASSSPPSRMTEPTIGSDLASMRTTAIRDGDHYVVNGSKTFITNGINADLVITAVKTDPTERHKGMSLLVLERGMAGFERGRNLDKVGLHAQDTAELFFTDVHVPVDNLLGDEGKGFVHLVDNLPQERLSIAMAGVAAAEAALRWTLDYTKERKAFGSPIGSFQNSRFSLAEMRTEIDIAQVFIDRCVEALNAGELTAEEAAEAKWWCTELQKRVVDRCVQLHGGYGYMLEYPIARAYVDARIHHDLRRHDRDHEGDHRPQDHPGLTMDRHRRAHHRLGPRATSAGRSSPIRKQARWRPVWFVDVDRDGEHVDAHGARRPHRRRPALPARARDEVPAAARGGRHPRAPRVRLVRRPARVRHRPSCAGENNFDAATDAERAAVMDEYMGDPRPHPPARPRPYERAGIARAADAGAVGTGRHATCTSPATAPPRRGPTRSSSSASGGWPATRSTRHGREAPVVWDSGQFHHQDGRVTAVLDLELGHVGDPMMDLAAFRMRDTVLGFGDMNVLYDQYAKHAGAPVDLAAIMHHHFAFTLSNQLAFHAALAAPPRRVRLHDQHAVGQRDEPLRDRGARRDPRHRRARSGRRARTAALTGGRGARAPRAVAAQPRRGRRVRASPAAHRVPPRPPPAAVRRDRRRVHRRRPRRPARAPRPTAATWQEGDAALEEFVLADAGAHDEELLQLFHRRYLRDKMLVGPAGSAMATHHPIQTFTA